MMVASDIGKIRVRARVGRSRSSVMQVPEYQWACRQLLAKSH